VSNRLWPNEPPQLREGPRDRVRSSRRAEMAGPDRLAARQGAPSRQPKKRLATPLREARKGRAIPAAEATMKAEAMGAAAWVRAGTMGAAARVRARATGAAARERAGATGAAGRVWEEATGVAAKVREQSMGAVARVTEQLTTLPEPQRRTLVTRLRGQTWSQLESATPRGSRPGSACATPGVPTCSLFLKSNVARADTTDSLQLAVVRTT